MPVAQPQSQPEPLPAWARFSRLLILGAACSALLPALLFATNPTRVASVVIFAATLQGLLLGGRAVLGVAVGLIVAAVVGLPLGGLMGHSVGAMFGQRGVIGVGVGVLVTCVAIAVVVAAVAAVALRLVTRQLPPQTERAVRIADPFVGAGVGFLEGLAVTLLLTWAVAAIRPIAEIAAAASLAAFQENQPFPGSPPPRRNALAEGFVEFTEGFENTLPGAVAAATNPVAANPIFDVADDFAVVMAHPEAREHFRADPVFAEIESLPSLRAAIDILKQDPAARDAIDADRIDARLALDLLRSDSALRALDETTVTDDLSPYVDRIRAALDEARRIADGSTAGEQPAPQP